MLFGSKNRIGTKRNFAGAPVFVQYEGRVLEMAGQSGKLIAGAAGVLLAAMLGLAQQEMPAGHVHDGDEADAMDSMASMKMEMTPHMKMTALRPPNEADQRRAESIVRELRVALGKYKDYQAAEQDGYQPFLASLDLPQYHFTNYRYGLIGALWFRPSKPTSLLYRKTIRGYELLGAMYTASRFATEEDLNQRVPLSVARWHAHINICLPPKSRFQSADWSQFGFTGSIAGEQACDQAGGTFYPQVFGWMVHVYPFEKSPQKIWAH